VYGGPISFAAEALTDCVRWHTAFPTCVQSVCGGLESGLLPLRADSGRRVSRDGSSQRRFRTLQLVPTPTTAQNSVSSSHQQQEQRSRRYINPYSTLGRLLGPLVSAVSPVQVTHHTIDSQVDAALVIALFR
jgi:hypothetical protein